MRPKLHSLIAIAIFLWASFATALELYRSWWIWNADPWSIERPSTWRVTSARVVALRQLLAPLEARQGELSVHRLAVLPGKVEGEGTFFVLWARYLLPSLEVIPIEHPPSGEEADFLLASPALDRLDEGYQPVRTSSAGTLYSVLPNAPAP